MLTLPFFDDTHRRLAAELAGFRRTAIDPLAAEVERGDPVSGARDVVRRAAAAGLLPLFVGRDGARPELRSLCLAREAVAAGSAFADSVLAVSGLGCFPIAFAGGASLADRYVRAAAAGDAVGAFALTEAGAGSDPSGIETAARRDGDSYVLSGRKLYISNAGVATFYVVFARTGAGSRGLSAFVVDAGAPGFRVERQIETSAPHPLGALAFDDCRVPVAQRVGEEGSGLKIALATLDFFRASVGAAACGLAARALDEARRYAAGRRQFGSAVADFQATKIALADMATELDAAWVKDAGAERVTTEASMAKLFATEAAQRIVDRAVQIHGARGVTRGETVERLYREVRALRIYEGTSEIQRLAIAGRLMEPGAPA